MSELTYDAVRQFMDLAQVDEAQARFLLEAAAGDTEAALQLLFDQAPNAASQGQQPAPQPVPHMPVRTEMLRPQDPLPPRPPAPALRAPDAERPARRPRLLPALLGTALRIPVFLIRTSLGVVSATLALGLGAGAYIGDRVLPAPVMRTLRGAVLSLYAGEELDALGQANKFITDFSAAYGQEHPNFMPLDLQSACVAARGEHRFLFVYLHAPDHEDTEVFCRQRLCESGLVAYVNTQFACWGGDIRLPDAHALSMRLGATTYPFVAVLSMANNNKATLVRAVQGTCLLAPEALLRVLQQCVDEQGVLLVAQRAEMNERETMRRLLAEQNAEYDASLAADREREERRLAQQREREQREREAAEQNARECALREAVQRRTQERIEAIARRRRDKQRLLPPEAEPGPGSAVVRVRLPDGTAAQRCFAASCTVANIFDLVDSLESTNYWKYNLVSNFPRKVFSQGGEATSTTLASAGLTPQAALFVQPQDEEDAPEA